MKPKAPGLLRRLAGALRAPRVPAPVPRRSIASIPSEKRVSHLRERMTEIVEARRASYRSASNPRRRDQQSLLGGSGDSHADAITRRLTRELSRDLDRNAGAFQTIGNKLEEFLVGPGVRYRPTTADTGWNMRAAEMIHQRMQQIEGGIDARQIRSGYGLQSVIARQMSVDGDLGVLKLADRTVQILESDQIAAGINANYGGTAWSTHEGVQLAPSGKVERFFACPYDPDTGVVLYDKAQAYTPDELLFHALTKRHSQTRGMPDLTAVLDDFERQDSYLESEIIAAELSSQIWVTLDYLEGRNPQPPFNPTDPNQNDTSLRGGYNAAGVPDWQQTAAGSAMVCPDGMRATPFSPQRPNINAEPFLIFLLRQHTGLMGYAYELFFNDFRNLSWSTAKSLVDMANTTTERRQTQDLKPLFSGIGTFVLWGLIEDGLLPHRDDWDRHEFEWPRMAQPDDEKFFKSNQLGFRTGQNSRVRVFGSRAFEIMNELAVEREHACILARALNEEYPEFPTTPEHFLGAMEAGAAGSAAPADAETEKTPSKVDA